MHDFKLFVQSRLALKPQTQCLADSGYLGLKKCHQSSRLPDKKSKLHPMTNVQKAKNRQLSSERFVIKHIIRSVKIFRVLAERYRNRRKRFGLRSNLIPSGCHTPELAPCPCLSGPSGRLSGHIRAAACRRTLSDTPQFAAGEFSLPPFTTWDSRFETYARSLLCNVDCKLFVCFTSKAANLLIVAKRHKGSQSNLWAITQYRNNLVAKHLNSVKFVNLTGVSKVDIQMFTH